MLSLARCILPNVEGHSGFRPVWRYASSSWPCREYPPYFSPFVDIYEEVEDIDNSPIEQEAKEASEDAEQYQIDIDEDSPPLEDEIATPSHQEWSSSLPSKPASLDPSPQLSYSAQVAKQFSAYQQTPSQERQQRREIPLPPNPRASARMNSFTSSGSEAAKTYVTSGGTVFGKKPSEMHDHG